MVKVSTIPNITLLILEPNRWMQFTHVPHMSIIKTAYDIIKFQKPNQRLDDLVVIVGSLQRSKKKTTLL